MPHSALKKCHIVALGQWKPEWPPAKVKAWVEEAGGKVTFQPKLTDEITHVVMLEKTWKEQGDFVKKVLTAKEEDHRDIHIVSYDWLEESLDHKSKRHEGKFSFEQMRKDLKKAARKEEKMKAKIEKAREPRSAAGLMAQVYTESTDPFVSEMQKARDTRQRDEALRIQEEKKTEQKMIASKLQERHHIKGIAGVFKRGVSKARNELLSENHHVYMDQSAFHYDVLLTRISFKNNKNQRHALTIYESNTLPHTYAFNCRYSGTNIAAQNNIIATLGSNWKTTLRAFRKTFKELTKVEWEDRVQDAHARFEREKRGVDDGRAPDDSDFDKAPFIYHPPLYGPRGADLEVPPLSTSPSAKPRSMQWVPIPSPGSWSPSPVNDDNGAWMSGANGDGAPISPHVAPPRENTTEQPASAEPTNEVAHGDAFQQLIADSENMPTDHLVFLGDTAFTDPFGFGDTNFDEEMTNGVESGHDFINDTQTQPSSQLPDTQDLGDSMETQRSGQMQQASQMPNTQSFGHTQAVEQVQADLMDFADEARVMEERSSSTERGLFGEAEPEARTFPPAAVEAANERLELGSSVLGKRKSSSDVAAQGEGASPKKVAIGQSGGNEKSGDASRTGEEYPLSPKPSAEPTRTRIALEGEDESQSQVDQGPESGFVDIGLDGVQASEKA